MIKDLTKTNKPSHYFSNKQLKSFVNYNQDKAVRSKNFQINFYKNLFVFYFLDIIKKQIDSENKKSFDSFSGKGNSSYINDRTVDTTFYNKKSSDATGTSNLLNYMRDSGRTDKSRSLNGSMIRPQSSCNMSYSTAKPKVRSDSNSSSNLLKSRKSLNNSRIEDIKKQTNKSFEDNGI